MQKRIAWPRYFYHRVGHIMSWKGHNNNHKVFFKEHNMTVEKKLQQIQIVIRRPYFNSRSKKFQKLNIDNQMQWQGCLVKAASLYIIDDDSVQIGWRY